MAEEVTQEGQKTLVAFIVGLLIGGMLVWAFSGPSADAPEMVVDEETTETTSTDDDTTSNDTEPGNTTDTETTEQPTLQVGNGDINVANQPAGSVVALDRAIYPVSEGWIGVREYQNEQLGFIKGVARFSESQGLVPSEVVLVDPTVSGRTYAIVVFTEDGDFDFNLAGDAQIDTIFDTFVAQ